MRLKPCSMHVLLVPVTRVSYAGGNGSGVRYVGGNGRRVMVTLGLLVAVGMVPSVVAAGKAFWLVSVSVSPSSGFRSLSVVLLCLAVAVVYAVIWFFPVAWAGSSVGVRSQGIFAGSLHPGAVEVGIGVACLGASVYAVGVHSVLVSLASRTRSVVLGKSGGVVTCTNASTSLCWSGYSLDMHLLIHSSVFSGIVLLAGRVSLARVQNWACTPWTEHPSLEIAWTVAPSMLLGLLTGDGLLALYSAEVSPGSITTQRSVLARQWLWCYGTPIVVSGDSSDGALSWVSGGEVESRYLGSKQLTLGSPRMMLADQPLYLPTNSSVLLSLTSADVLHAFSVPALGIKADAVPGRISTVTSHTSAPGIYTGFCSELCGTGHGFMPINVCVHDVSGLA